MQKELSIVLRNRIKALPFIDVLAGLAQTLTRQVAVNEGASFITEKEPVSNDVRGTENQGKQISMVPNSQRKSLIYFEDRNGVQPGDDGEGSYKCTMRLVCWMNKANLVGDPYANITGRCVAALNQAICSQHKKANIFHDLNVTFAGTPVQDAGIFSRYTYKETDRQYLRPPYEFFAIDYLCKFSVDPNCLSEIDWNIKVCY